MFIKSDLRRQNASKNLDQLQASHDNSLNYAKNSSYDQPKLNGNLENADNKVIT